MAARSFWRGSLMSAVQAAAASRQATKASMPWVVTPHAGAARAQRVRVRHTGGTMGRLFVGAYALAAYALFLATVLLMMGFLLGFGPAVIDSGPPAPLAVSILVNLGLMALFAVQHGVMARQRFKNQLIRFIPPAAERRTFVLAASLILIAMAVEWRPLPQALWTVEAPWARVALT